MQHSDKYEVNQSTQKKIVFHLLTRALSDLEPSAALCLSPRSLVDAFVSDLAAFAKENAAKFGQTLQKRLNELNVDAFEPLSSLQKNELMVELKPDVERMVDNVLV